MRLVTRTTAAVIAGCLTFAAGPADAVILKSYITGEVFTPTLKHVIFTVTFDPSVLLSGTIVTTLEDTAHRLDGIDFVPGTGETEVVAAGTYLSPPPNGVVGHYKVDTGTILPPYIVFTSTASPIPPPPPPITTHPSSVKSTDTHFYYTENQFGFEAADPHRIIRAPFAGGAAEVVFSGADPAVVTAFGAPLAQLEGIEIHDGRIYFFARDPTTSSPTLKRALFSASLTGGVATGVAPVLELGGLTRGTGLAGAGPGTSDGSDELDFDPFTGLLWGTNITDGQLIAYDPVTMTGGVVLDAATIATGSTFGLKLLTRRIDGIRSTGEGHLVFVGLDGTIGAIDLTGFVSGGGLGFGSILDSDVFPLFDDRLDDGMGVDLEFAFDDLTPLAVVSIPEPGTMLLVLVAAVFLVPAVRQRSCGKRRSATV